MMKNKIIQAVILILTVFTACSKEQNGWIRINQIGYRNNDIKVAVLLSKESLDIQSFRVINAATGKTEMVSSDIEKAEPLDPFISCYRLPFTELTQSGTYMIIAGDIKSPEFRIGADVYDGTADFLLNYMRQQRCGYNPYLKDSCHTRDGYVVYGPTDDSAHIDVTGGWHDAADYLQYVATSANATYQMLFALSENPAAFSDKYLASGDPGSDGLPDVLNEIRWGLDWLIKMNPAPGVMYNQIADDRDHIGFRYPNKDTAKYGKGLERPVYFCTGEPQGAVKYKNRATGVASSAGKFASAFAKASLFYSNTDKEFSIKLTDKAKAAFDFGLSKPGVCQTAPGSAPYFYEEDNWTDDMELAAIELFNVTGEKKYYDYALEFGRKEPVTPWIGADTARHYQWYPFVNMGHPAIARQQKKMNDSEFAGYMKKGLELTMDKAVKNPFLVGVPFIWCSNNLVAAILTQSRLYSEITGDDRFAEMEAAHRDWLFGCNPWGTSMVVGLPANGDFPENSHSSYVIKGEQVPGGLVDGPVYSSIFNSLKFIYLSAEDEYAQFQTKLAVYHDDFADYSTNECTMDGTASLVYYMSGLQSKRDQVPDNHNLTYSRGAIVRMDTTKKEVWLTFTAHEFTDGFDYILKTLGKHGIKASFFLTGDFCRGKGNEKIIQRLKSDGHYIGPHSDKHLLYCSWEKRDSLLVSMEEFLNDLEGNYNALKKFDILKNDAQIFLPPYEWYNDTITTWAKNSGVTMINMSSGTNTNQDWTVPEEGKPYFSSDSLMQSLKKYETRKNLNGYILLIHPGTDPRRTDKFYLRLDEVLKFLESRNYRFRSFSEII
jgi:endoglucanase